MKDKTYPRIGEKSSMADNLSFNAPKSGSKRCAICHYGAAIMRIDIQIDQFRGNDDVIFLCQPCAWLPDNEILLKKESADEG